jgi:CBS domain-containing protein
MPEAHKIMTTHGIRRLPLVDRHGHLVGIITLGDVRGAEPSQATSLSIWEMNYLMAKLKAKEIMTSNPITVFETATIGAAARIMLDSRISGLPVVDRASALVGIITESDIFSMVVLEEWRVSETERAEIGLPV